MNKILKYSTYIILSLTCFVITQSCSVLNGKKKKAAAAKAAQLKNKAKMDSTELAKTKIKSFKDFFKGPDTSSHKGLVGLYRMKDNWYFEIPDSLLNRAILLTTRIDQAPYGLKTRSAQYGGEKIEEAIWNFQKTKKRIDIIFPDYSVKVDSLGEMYQAVNNSNRQSIVKSFPIASYNKDTTGVLIDVTAFINGAEVPFSLSRNLLKGNGLGNLESKSSSIDTIITYKQNVEISTTKTFSSETRSEGAATFKLHTSLLLLPKTPAKPRIGDQRVGIFSQKVRDFDKNPQGVEDYRLVRRWKLIPKDTAAYLKGELVEPEKQIVIYIDPATPKVWVPYLIQGINDWNTAFEKAGFKNAIVGKIAPKDDPEFDVNDARYSVLRYFASETQNAYGPHTADPRSGEIIETHIGWYHNVMELIRNWYRTQTAAANPKARPQKLPEAEMGQLIRFVSSHEVGHTLGLMHNFGSSYVYTPEQLRSKSFTDAYGTAPSIMDYARFNYIAQPGDGVTNFFPKIGSYDQWAIKWAYSWFPDSYTPEQEKQTLDKWVQSHAGDPKFFYGPQGNDIDPRDQSEDLSNDAMKAGVLGIANLKRIVLELPKWTYEAGKTYDQNLGVAYNNIVNQWYRYIGHTMQNVGGIYQEVLVYGQSGASNTLVPKNIQKNAVNFLCQEAFSFPNWLRNKDISDKLAFEKVDAQILQTQSNALAALFSEIRLNRMVLSSAQTENSYSLFDLYNDISTHLFKTAKADNFKRYLQLSYINTFDQLLNNSKSLSLDASAIVRASLNTLLIKVKNYTKSTSGVEKAHYQNLEFKIKKILEGEKKGNPTSSGINIMMQPRLDSESIQYLNCVPILQMETKPLEHEKNDLPKTILNY